MKNVVGYLLIAFFVAGLANYFVAAERKEAHITAVIKDVSVLARNAARTAVLNDLVSEGNAVRTGTDSRAELTFTDQTLARVGANSVFSFGAGGKEFDLASGAMLLAAPKSAGTIKVNTAAVTAAVSGFTVLLDSQKVLVMEGTACVGRKGHPGEPCITLNPGDMISFDNGKLSQVKKISIDRVVRTAKLVTTFKKPLPAWSLNAIKTAVNNQGGATAGGSPPGGYYNDQGGNNATYQRNEGTPPPQPPKPPPPPPPTPLPSPPS